MPCPLHRFHLAVLKLHPFIKASSLWISLQLLDHPWLPHPGKCWGGLLTKSLNELGIPQREAKGKGVALASWFFPQPELGSNSQGRSENSTLSLASCFLFPCTPVCGFWEWGSRSWQNYCLSYSLGAVQLKHTEVTWQHFKVSATGPAMEAWHRILISLPLAVIPIPGSCVAALCPAPQQVPHQQSPWADTGPQHAFIYIIFKLT